MSYQFPLDVEQFLQQEVNGGRYPDRNAVLIEAVRRWQRDSSEPLVEIQGAVDDFAAGRFQSLDETIQLVRRAAEANR